MTLAPTARDDVPAVIRALVAAMAPLRPPAAGTEQPVGDDTPLTRGLGYDSLRLMELAIALEQRFGLPPIGSGQATTLATVGDVVRLVTELARSRSNSAPTGHGEHDRRPTGGDEEVVTELCRGA